MIKNSVLPRDSIPPYCVFFSWYINNECDYKCTYCKPQNIKTVFVDVKEWMDVWDGIYQKYGSCNLHFSGGEPFMYPKFMDLITALAKRHTLEFSTNLSTDIRPFMDAIGTDRARVGGSFHPEFADFAVFFKKIIQLRKKGFEVWINYVAWPPALNGMAEYRKIVEEAGVRFSILPFNGDYQGRSYPQNYTEYERDILMEVGGLDVVNKDTIDWRTDEKKNSVKGRLCRMGQMYARIYPDAEVYRCCGNGSSRLGNILDGSFKLLEEPLLCECDNCPCHKCMLVDKEKHWLTFWGIPERRNLIGKLT